MTDQMFVYEKTVPDVLNSMANVNAKIGEQTLKRELAHLVELRASQINKCAYCVKMHTADARRDGETDARLDRLVVWRHVSDFSEAEKAAFAWTEALTSLDESIDLAALREDLSKHFDANQIGALTSLIAQINLWNRIQRSVY